MKKTFTEQERSQPFRELLRQALPDQEASTNEEVASMSGTQLRDRLIAHQPLDRDWIACVNQASGCSTASVPEQIDAILSRVSPCIVSILA